MRKNECGAIHRRHNNEIVGEPARQEFAVVPGIDLLSAKLDGLTILVNRDNGLYCTLEGGSSVWQWLQDGPVHLAGAALSGPLFEAGIVRLVNTTTADAPLLAVDSGVTATLHEDLAEQIRPWQAVARPQRQTTSLRARKLVEALESFFEDMVETHGVPIVNAHSIGDHAMRVRTLPGQISNQLLEAISHLASPDPAAAVGGLMITAWNSSALSKSPVLAHLLIRLLRHWQTACGPRGEVLDLHCEDISAIFNPGPDVLSVVDFRSHRAWVLKCNDQPYPYWEIGSPFRFAMHEWFAAEGLQYVHGGAVGNEHGAVLLVGKGGSGKSTTSLVCAAAGMRYLGDDYCLADCRTDPDQPWIHSLYGTGKLTCSEDFLRLPELRNLSINPDSFERGGNSKGVYSLSRLWPKRVVTGLPLRAIMIPQVCGGVATTIEPCSRQQALLALLPSTVGQLPGCTDADCRRIVTLVEQLPAYTLALGSDPAGIAAAVAEVLDS